MLWQPEQRDDVMKHNFRREERRPRWPGIALVCLLAFFAGAAVVQAGEKADADAVTSVSDGEAAGGPEGGLVNWTTTIAQVVNFLVLVALLKYFLYDRITSAIDNRAKRIASEEEEARKKQEDADLKARTYEEKLDEFEENRQALLEEAKAEAGKLREELTRQAREEVDKTRGRWLESLRQEQGQFMQLVRGEIGRHVCAISRQALSHLASGELESAMVETFLRQLESNRDAVGKLLEKARGEGLTVRSAFELEGEARQGIEEAIRSNGHSVAVRFETDPSLLCGIELRAEGNAIGWSLDKYLGEVEEGLNKTLRQTAGQG